MNEQTCEPLKTANIYAEVKVKFKDLELVTHDKERKLGKHPHFQFGEKDGQLYHHPRQKLPKNELSVKYSVR